MVQEIQLSLGRVGKKDDLYGRGTWVDIVWMGASRGWPCKQRAFREHRSSHSATFYCCSAFTAANPPIAIATQPTGCCGWGVGVSMMSAHPSYHFNPTNAACYRRKLLLSGGFCLIQSSFIDPGATYRTCIDRVHKLDSSGKLRCNRKWTG